MSGRYHTHDKGQRDVKNSDYHWAQLIAKSNEMCATVREYNSEVTKIRLKEDADSLLKIINRFQESIGPEHIEDRKFALLNLHLSYIQHFFAAVRDTYKDHNSINNVILYFNAMNDKTTQETLAYWGFGCHLLLQTEIDRMHEQMKVLYRGSIDGHSPYVVKQDRTHEKRKRDDSIVSHMTKRIKPNSGDMAEEEEFSKITDRQWKKDYTSRGGVNNKIAPSGATKSTRRNTMQTTKNNTLPPYATPTPIRYSSHNTI